MRTTPLLALTALLALAACQDPNAPQAPALTPAFSAGDNEPLASGGGNIESGMREGFQVHIHSFAFRLNEKNNKLDFQLTYHDHHEGAATTPIHNEPDAFSLRMTEFARVLRGPAPGGAGQFLYVEGWATQRMAGRPHHELRVWACMWAEDRADGNPDRFHLETAPPPAGNNYTSGGFTVFRPGLPPTQACSGPGNTAPPTPLAPGAPGYDLNAGNITIH